MKINYTITFKDALFLATHLIDKEKIKLMYSDDQDPDNKLREYQYAFELFNLAETIYRESLKRSNED
ncbi:hypothetical protein SAMN05660772_02054 [Pasteurella testudinis DSM 23072]|uniref:Uncharacterized protein n=1 Tax=Pasteurella testudinis DSM 23072 TaxID=1122938 RepID=A0A1W1UMM0_9PAST|nr:hypothetical protein SAMN05660772_02054 [Pasteurella testudinis DSM 23072]SUB51492.1 Uncharacterised protein [Pasteurella testudinis]